jgi:hypothetical protein
MDGLQKVFLWCSFAPTRVPTLLTLQEKMLHLSQGIHMHIYGIFGQMLRNSNQLYQVSPCLVEELQ